MIGPPATTRDSPSRSGRVSPGDRPPDDLPNRGLRTWHTLSRRRSTRSCVSESQSPRAASQPARAKGGHAQPWSSEGCDLWRHIQGPAAQRRAIALAITAPRATRRRCIWHRTRHRGAGPAFGGTGCMAAVGRPDHPLSASGWAVRGGSGRAFGRLRPLQHRARRKLGLMESVAGLRARPWALTASSALGAPHRRDQDDSRPTCRRGLAAHAEPQSRGR